MLFSLVRSSSGGCGVELAKPIVLSSRYYHAKNFESGDPPLPLHFIIYYYIFLKMSYGFMNASCIVCTYMLTLNWQSLVCLFGGNINICLSFVI